MHDPPAPAVWLAMAGGLLVPAAVHACAAWKLASPRPHERAWSLKPRTNWLLLLTFATPLLPFSALVVLAFAFKPAGDGAAPQGGPTASGTTG